MKNYIHCIGDKRQKLIKIIIIAACCTGERILIWDPVLLFLAGHQGEFSLSLFSFPSFSSFALNVPKSNIHQKIYQRGISLRNLFSKEPFMQRSLMLLPDTTQAQAVSFLFFSSSDIFVHMQMCISAQVFIHASRHIMQSGKRKS